MRSNLKKAVFLDRDGTIIEDRGHLRSPDDVVFYPDTLNALRKLQEHFLLFIVTHQPGVASGIISTGEVALVNNHVVSGLREQGVVISAVYCCPHRRDERCACIKPNPYHLHEAAREYGLDLARSFVIGDHPHDVALADNAGASGIYVLTGHGAKHYPEMRACKAVVPGIREAVDWISASVAMQDMEARQPGSLDKAADLLRNGGIVAFPTETVYGLGAAVFKEKAVARVFEAKRRPHFDPLIVHVSGQDQLPDLVEEIPAMAKALMEQFWPGPLTLVLPKSQLVPDLVTSGLPTVAVRMPRHPLALKLIDSVGMPVAAPSANPFGYTSPTTARHVHECLGGSVDMILDGGSCAVGVESTILSLVSGRPVLLRPGGIAVEDIERVAGPVTAASPAAGSGAIAAPGMLPRHYSPRTPLRLIPECEAWPLPAPGLKVGLLSFGKVPDPGPFACVEVLSESGDLREAAAALFGTMRRMDERHLDLILTRLVPQEGLGRAINDRLIRAAGLE